MKKARKDSQNTRQRLIEAASDIFACRGFTDTTVAEICEHAHTNVASVNYHFGDKETLYAEAWRYSFRESLQKFPPEGGVSDDAPAEERLKGRIESILRRIFDNDLKAFSIMLKEVANPTGLLQELLREEIHPIREKMKDLVRELLGPDVSEKQVMFCKVSIMSQCFHLIMIRQWCDKKGPFSLPIERADIDDFVNHIVKFSMAGINAIREEVASKTSSNN